MAATFAEVIDQNTKAFEILQLIHEISATVTDNFITLEDGLQQATEGETEGIQSILGGLSQIRAGLNAALAAGPLLANGILLNARPFMDVPERDIPSLRRRLYDYMVANSKTFNDRDFSRGSFSADGGNTGTGTIYRFTVDAGGYNIQRGFVDVTTCTIVADAAGGRDGRQGTDRGREIFEFRGGASGNGLIDLELSGRGSGQILDIPNLSADDSLVDNPTFAQFSGTESVPTEITSWTVENDIDNFELDGTNTYRTSIEEGSTPYAVNITATDSLQQLLSVSGTKLNNDAPYLCRIAWNRAVGSASGTLVLHLGAVSKSVSVSAQTGWQLLAIDQDEDAWFENFTEDESTDVFIDWTRTGGEILVDDLVFAQAIAWPGDGCFVAPVGGATNWRVGDFGTITDTETGGVMARWWWRTSNWSPPTATGGGESESDPAVAYS